MSFQPAGWLADSAAMAGWLACWLAGSLADSGHFVFH